MASWGTAIPGVAKLRKLGDLAGSFVRKRLPDLVDLAMVLVIFVSAAVAVLNRSVMLTGNVMAGSTAAAALCFLLASRSLRRCKGVGYERMFIAACAMAGGIMLFELFYHLGRPESWRVLPKSLTTFGLDLARPGAPFPVLWALMAFSTVFVGARYMRANRWFWLVVGAGAAWFLLWFAVGFPNYFEPRRWPESFLVLQLIPPEYAHPRDPSAPGWAVVSAWGAVLHTGAKVLIGILPATFFMHNLRRTPADKGASPDDLLSRVWFSARSRFKRKAPVESATTKAGPGRIAIALTARLAPVNRFVRRAADFLAPKVADLADLAMVSVILVCVSVAVVKQSFFLTGNLLAGSLIGFALSYLLVSRSLRGRKELGVQRVFISLCVMVSSMWLFEIVFHYWGWNGYRYFFREFLSLHLSAPWNTFPFFWSLIMLSLMFVGARYARPNRYFIIGLAVAVTLFWIWKAAGFPTFTSPQLWPQAPPLLPFIPPEYAHAPTPQASETIRFWAVFLNSAAKVAWCAVPGTLFLTRENLGGPLRARLWPPGPALRRLFMPWTQWPTASAGKPVSAPALAPAPAGQPSAPSSGGGEGPP